MIDKEDEVRLKVLDMRIRLLEAAMGWSYQVSKNGVVDDTGVYNEFINIKEELKKIIK